MYKIRIPDKFFSTSILHFFFSPSAAGFRPTEYNTQFI